jgi:hypothetical protein
VSAPNSVGTLLLVQNFTRILPRVPTSSTAVAVVGFTAVGRIVEQRVTVLSAGRGCGPYWQLTIATNSDRRIPPRTFVVC